MVSYSGPMIRRPWCLPCLISEIFSTSHETIGQAIELTWQRSIRPFRTDSLPALQCSFRPILGRKGTNRVHDGNQHGGFHIFYTCEWSDCLWLESLNSWDSLFKEAGSAISRRFFPWKAILSTSLIPSRHRFLPFRGNASAHSRSPQI